MDNEDENLLILLAPNVLRISELHVETVSHKVLSFYHGNKKPSNFLMSEILLDESLHYAPDRFE